VDSCTFDQIKDANEKLNTWFKEKIYSWELEREKFFNERRELKYERDIALTRVHVLEESIAFIKYDIKYTREREQMLKYLKVLNFVFKSINREAWINKIDDKHQKIVNELLKEKRQLDVQVKHKVT
jgi:hypothetical protein